MNFIVVCLHCLDMRDFHSRLSNTPFLDKLKKKSLYIPCGRGQGHNRSDSLNPELTGVWTPSLCDGKLADTFWNPPAPKDGLRVAYPKTVIEYLHEAGYEIITFLGRQEENREWYDTLLGTDAANGLTQIWMENQPDRWPQLLMPDDMHTVEDWISRIKESRDKFYAHIVLRNTHRPWGQNEGLCALVGEGPAQKPNPWPHDAYCSRKAALTRPDEFAALRRRGLAAADKRLERIFEATSDIPDVTYVVYSNHGELYDFYRYVKEFPTQVVGRKKMARWTPNDQRLATNMVTGSSHAQLPYEILHANMQMWVIPGQEPCVMTGTGRTIDFAPTVLELAGTQPDDMDGESMLPFFGNGSFPARDRYAGWQCLGMVRKDGWKFLANPPKLAEQSKWDKIAVFDLTGDPYEYVNLLETPQGQEVQSWAIAKYRELKESRKSSKPSETGTWSKLQSVLRSK